MGFVLKVFLSFLLLLHLVKGGKKVFFLKSDVQFNTTYIENNAVVIIKNGTAIDIHLSIKGYPRDPWVNLDVAKRDAKSRIYVPIFSYDIDVCRFLGRKNHNDKLNLLQIWFENYWKQGNMPRSCPIQNGTYFWKGVRFDRSSLANFLQPGIYRSNVKTYFKADPQLHIPYVSVANVTVYGIYKTV